MQNLSPKEVNQLLEYYWSTGNLRGLLYEHQRPMYDLFQQGKSMDTVFHCSRRLGKSAIAMLIQLEICLASDGKICRFGAPTQDAVREILIPMLNDLCFSAPERFKPVFHSSGRFLFPHRPNSQLVIAGIDLYPDRLRGPKCDGFVIDEAGFVKDLEYVIKDIAMPQFLTTSGRLLLTSTSPKTPMHPFTARMAKAEEQGSYIKRTIYDDSRPIS